MEKKKDCQEMPGYQILLGSQHPSIGKVCHSFSNHLLKPQQEEYKGLLI